MAEQIVRCPYCMLGDQGKPMLQRPTWYVCERCGHALTRSDGNPLIRFMTKPPEYAGKPQMSAHNPVRLPPICQRCKGLQFYVGRPFLAISDVKSPLQWPG
jgi:hypothetical protein